MAPTINVSTHKVTAKQKKDLLGIYQDYLYFMRGIEMILQVRTIDGLAGSFMADSGWSNMSIPWQIGNTSKKEHDTYIRFVNGDTQDAQQYTYISLYHTDKNQDVTHPKISDYPENYDFTTIDLDLPCLIERYAIAFPKGQKVKDAQLIIDGSIKTAVSDKNDIVDMTIAEALADTKIQQQFRTLLCLVEIYNRNRYKILNSANPEAAIQNIMKRVAASEEISHYENKLLDLLGTCADKTKEILHALYPDKPQKDLWTVAEQNGLITSADSMAHFINIRHLIRHQWDSLDNLSKYSTDGSCRNEEMRAKYMESYHWLFQNTLHKRVKLYQQFCLQFQPLIQIFHPEFLAREKGESRSKFTRRIKQWQKDNPNKTPLISGNYPLYDADHISLISVLKKVAPDAVIFDNLTEEDLSQNETREENYSKRTAYLKMYSQLENCFALYCLTNGINIRYIDMWEYLKKKFFTKEEYNRWSKYHQLRNNLSHNHLDEKLAEEMNTLLDDTFEADVNKLEKFLNENTPNLTRSEDGFFLAEHSDGSVVKIDLKNNTILAHSDKDGNDILNQDQTIPGPRIKSADTPVKLKYQQGEVVECRFKNGIVIDLKRKKISFPDNSQIHCDSKDHIIFQFPNKNKIFMDKTFSIISYLERNNNVAVSRSETFIASPKHKIRTDRFCRLIESCIIGEDNQKLITKMKHSSRNSFIIFADGTEINVSAGKFIVSHNDVVLSYKNCGDFVCSYYTPQTPPFPPKTPPTR